MAPNKGKGVFTDQLGDIDEFLPPPIPVPTVEPEKAVNDASASAPGRNGEAQVDRRVQPSPAQSASAAVAQPRASAQEPRPRRRRSAVSTPTAEVAPDVCKALRRFTSREKARDPMTARTFAQVVLDAIDASQHELATFWKDAQSAQAGGGGLFSRRPATPPRRRRHSEPPGRVPLTGLHPDDAATIDSLVEQWQAPSRSALVEQALRLYAPLWPAARRGKRGDSSEAIADDEDLDATG